jgi:hypothetical protein
MVKNGGALAWGLSCQSTCLVCTGPRFNPEYYRKKKKKNKQYFDIQILTLRKLVGKAGAGRPESGTARA